jgi:hypothetical protein
MNVPPVTLTSIRNARGQTGCVAEHDMINEDDKTNNNPREKVISIKSN